MKHPLHFVNLSDIPIFQQLQWEEALLRADKRNWCLFNRGSPPAIILGISGRVNELVNEEELKKFPIPVIRRFSGGGTVVVDENTLFVTLICQSEAISVSPFPRHLMQWTAELYRPLFPQGLFELQENDYALRGRKWGGNAQSIIKGRWLHHSSLLWDYQPHLMNYLSLPPKMPTYRQSRSHLDFLCRLREFSPSPSFFQNRLLQELSRHFHILEKERKEIEEIAALPHRKATLFEKTPPKGT